MAAKILVVEDDESMCELLRLHLEHAGYEVAVTEDGIGAGYAVLQSPPDLIVCDVDMPNMDGFQLVEGLRADAALPPMPVIFLTSAEDAAGAARRIGVRDPAAQLARRDLEVGAQLLRAAEELGGASQCAAVDAPHRGTMEP